ncbi:MAG TPA: hypothetical protein VMY77_17460 [Chitinophagaceae bacterium]|nr:hypothetical protein [Chitinophagaceae bacterium]
MIFRKEYVYTLFIFMNMKSRLFILIIFLSPIFSSCNDPMDKTYSPAGYVNDIAAIRESNKVSYEDVELLTQYITLSKIAGNDLEGNTYEEILGKIKDIRNANTNMNEKVQMERDALREKMSPYLSVTLSGKNFSKVNNIDHLVYTVTFQNLSAKSIKMVVGSISLNDLIDREIKIIDVVLDEQLRYNATLKKTFTVVYDHNSENDKQIRSKELIDLRIIWNPVKIIFEDGTVAE